MAKLFDLFLSVVLKHKSVGGIGITQCKPLFCFLKSFFECRIRVNVSFEFSNCSVNPVVNERNKIDRRNFMTSPQLGYGVADSTLGNAASCCAGNCPFQLLGMRFQELLKNVSSKLR